MQTHPNLQLQTPSFPLLPIPLLLSPLPSSDYDLLLCCFSASSASNSGLDLAIGVSCQLDSFPVGDALSSFLSSVLPQPIDVRSGDFTVDVLDRAAGSGNAGVQVSEEKDKKAKAAKDDNWIDIVQFEVPELGSSLDGACKLEREREEILLKVSECEQNLEMIHLSPSDPHLDEVQRSVYSVEDVPPNSRMDVKINISEDVDFSLRKDLLSDAVFPQVELEEITIGTFSGISMEDELLSLLGNMEALDNTEKYDNEVNWQELFCSMKIEQVSDQISSKLFLEPLSAQPNFFMKTGHEYITETSCTEEEPRFCSGIFLADSDFLVKLVPFEEFEILDPECFEISDAFSIPQINTAPGKCDKSSMKGMNFKNFDELVVCHEISMVDHNFKSFPVPILHDDEKVQSLHVIITILLEGLEPLPVSASDEIYLDWDLLGKDKGNCDIHATLRRMFSDIRILSVDYDVQSTEGTGLLLDFILSDDILNEITAENKMNMPSGGNTTVTKPLSAALTGEMLDDDHQRAEGGENKTGVESEKISLRAESVPQFNELEFFLNHNKGITGTRDDVLPGKLDTKSGIPAGTSQGRKRSSLCLREQMYKWDLKLHVVNLPANMLTLIQSFGKCFLAVTEDLHLNSRQFSFPVVDDMLSIPEEKLMDCMKILCKDKTFSGHVNAVTSAFCALLAIKRMTWCLCVYGIHSLYEFIDEVLQKFECLSSRLGLLMPYIEEAYMLGNKEITKLHPSLGLIQEILKMNTSPRSNILIVAEQKFWWPLKSLLVSMNVAVSEVTSSMQGSFLDASDVHKTSQSGINVVQPDCLLATHEHISAAIRSKQFDIILEYGGLRSSSQVSSILPESPCCLNLHFLKVELDGAAKALCTGVNLPISSMKLEELLNFVPLVENCKSMSMDTIDQKNDCGMPLPVDCLPIESKSNSAKSPSCPHTTIIVNTQNFDTEMIISQRSTYQRILAMEKGGAQILERDFCLPVDVIISAATCLAWYNCKNIGKKATAPDEAASCVPLCVDNIATNVLTTLSFTFGSCIMVFEGESNFITTIAESSDELYAAAASLGIELQIFCSYSPELTKEIVLNCIRYAMKFRKGLFPKLSESETIAESFLTKFPSINPFSALAILSTGAMLVEFFGWSKDCRIQALHKYHVPDESVILLSLLSRYGKRDDSISCMTDCSSSVSSAPNSERIDCKFSFEKRKREFNESSFDDPDDFRIHHPASMNVDNLYKPSTSRLLNTSRKSKSPEQPLDVEAFYEELRVDAEKINPIMVSEPQISWRSRDPNLMNDIAGASLPSNSRFTSSGKLPEHDADIFKGLRDDFMGEVFDIHDEPLFGGNLSSVKKAANFSLPKCESDEAPGIKSSRAVRRLAFEHGTHPDISTLAQISSDSNQWNAKENDRRARQGRDSHDANSGFDIFGLDHQKDLLGGRKIEKAPTYLQRLLNKEKAPYGYEGTPLRNAIYSKDLQGASPWTKEFLNQVREKIRLHKQYPNNGTPIPCPNYRGTSSKATKRKSPSIYESFNYQAGRTPSKLARRVRQKPSTQLSTLSKNENDSSMLPRSWIPADKRATQTLSFATCGNGGQTKLVWRDKSSESQGYKFPRSR